MRSSKLNRDLGRLNPARAFASPVDLVGEVLMTRGEKLATLERWRLDVLSQLDAAGEGMATRGLSRRNHALLDEIETAKRSLRA